MSNKLPEKIFVQHTTGYWTSSQTKKDDALYISYEKHATALSEARDTKDALVKAILNFMSVPSCEHEDWHEQEECRNCACIRDFDDLIEDNKAELERLRGSE